MDWCVLTIQVTAFVNKYGLPSVCDVSQAHRRSTMLYMPITIDIGSVYL